MTAFMLVMAITVGLVVLYAGVLPLVLEQQHTRAARRVARHVDDEHDAHNLQIQYDLLLASILDLDFDYDMGKLTDNVYAEQRKMLLGRSVYILKKLDAVLATQASQNDVDAQIEAMIAARRGHGGLDIDARMEADIAAAKKAKVAL